MDGALAASTKDGERSAATVIIQYTTVGTSRFTEYGSRPRYAKTTSITGRSGSGSGERIWPAE